MRERNIQELAHGTCGVFLHFTMTRDGRDFAVSGIFPDRMVAALSCEEAAVVAEVAFEVGQLHAATS